MPKVRLTTLGDEVIVEVHARRIDQVTVKLSERTLPPETDQTFELADGRYLVVREAPRGNSLGNG